MGRLRPGRPGHRGAFLLLDRSPDGAFARLAAAWPGCVSGVGDHHGTPTWVLVRPDRVVAWASDTSAVTDVTALEAALRRRAGAPSSSSGRESVS
ncbi:MULTISPECIES: hypothetical protein [Streptomyces]|uniref:aromatic-ring hydroxylase C-terminal domain-containing protein n=1 Tax=Streptomyces TaxID=1883 RepID=UPI0004CDA7F2|nr:hypothetical protein [Streptomyces durhamensis]